MKRINLTRDLNASVVKPYQIYFQRTDAVGSVSHAFTRWCNIRIPFGSHFQVFTVNTDSSAVHLWWVSELVRRTSYQHAAKRAQSSRGGFVKSYNWGTIEAPIRDPDGIVIIFVIYWDPQKEQEIKRALSEIKPSDSIRWIDERTVTEFPESD